MGEIVLEDVTEKPIGMQAKVLESRILEEEFKDCHSLLEHSGLADCVRLNLRACHSVFGHVFGAVNGLGEVLNSCLGEDCSEATIRKGERNPERAM